MSRRQLHRWSILAVTAFGLAVRLASLDAQSLWLDEGITFIWATLPFHSVVSQLLAIATQTPLYYTLVRFCIWTSGTSSFALRFLSAWTSTLTVPVVYITGKEARGPKVGLLAASLLAFNPFHVWYAQEARMYALTILLCAGILVAFMRALRSPGWRGWLTLALLSGLGYLVHWFSLTLAAAQFAVILLDLDVLYLRFRRWVVAQVLAAVPTLVWVLSALAKRGTTRLRADWIPRPSLLAPLYTFFNYSLGYEESPSLWLLVGYALFLGAFAVPFRSRGRNRWRKTLVAWMIVPIGATYLISLYKSVYVDRYMSVVLPAFLLWIALGVAAVPRRWRSFAAAALLAASVLGTMGIVSGQRYQKEDWRSAIRQVRQMARPGDRLFVASPEDVPVSHYYLEDELPLEVGLAEQSVEGRTWFLYRIPAESNHQLGELPDSSFRQHADPQVQRWARAYADELIDRWQYPGLQLFLLEEDH